MLSTFPHYCNACGAANQTQETHCFACGQALNASAPDAASSRPLLLQRYQILSMIGKGGFGAVYKAVDTQRDGLLVAIKEINLGGLSPKEIIEATEAFNREVLLLSGLRHPNLPQMYDHFTDPEHWYLVMDFIEGQTLEEYLHLTQKGRLPVDEVLDIGIQLCTVLKYLHTRQPPIVFRDVKPANVMRTPKGQLFLIDFGIARHFKPGQSRDTQALGSPGYAAPEQYGKAQTTVQTDIYGLGATLYELLTGDDPSNTPFVFISLHAQNEGVPTDLKRLLLQMLDMDTGKRPASMGEVERALQRMKDKFVGRVRYPQGVYVAQQPFSQSGARGQILQPPVPRPAAKRGISRRTAIIGLIGLAEVAVVGFGVARWLQPSPGNMDMAFHDPATFFTYHGHSDQVNTVAWAPGSNRVVSASNDGTVQVWEATGSPILTYQKHTGPVSAAVWSPNGKFIASCGGWADTSVHVWNAITGDTLLVYRGHEASVNAVAWSPNGKRIASISYDLQIWDAATGGKLQTQVFQPQGQLTPALTWSPNSKRIATSSASNVVEIFDVNTGSSVASYSGHTGKITAVEWSPDGFYIAIANFDRTVEVQAIASGDVIYTYRGHSDGVNAVAWSPDGKRIASGSADNTVQVWNATSGDDAYTYRGHSEPVNGVMWSPDGQYIASASTDKTVQVWFAR